MPETPDIPDALPLADEAAVMDETAAPTSDPDSDRGRALREVIRTGRTFDTARCHVCLVIFLSVLNDLKEIMAEREQSPPPTQRWL